MPMPQKMANASTKFSSFLVKSWGSRKEQFKLMICILREINDTSTEYFSRILRFHR